MHTRHPKARLRQEELQFLSTFSFPYLLEFRYLEPGVLQMDSAQHFCFSRPYAIDGYTERNCLTRTAVSSGFSSGKKWPPFIRCPCACGAHCRQMPSGPPSFV